MQQTRILFEACCGSAGDVLEAAQGGANRVELNSDLFHGGLTPSIGTLQYARAHTDIPILCMVRPREGGFHYSEVEFQVMLHDARAFLNAGADGIVFGFLHEDGTVDADRCRQMLAVIGEKQSVFHRAIDVAPDVFAALDTLIELGITRVLTSGQAPTVAEGVALIRRMIAHAAGRIEIQPGGGIDPMNAAWCREQTGATMIHAALHRTVYDRSAMGNPAIYFGGAVYPPEDRYALLDAEGIAAMRRSIGAVTE